MLRHARRWLGPGLLGSCVVTAVLAGGRCPEWLVRTAHARSSSDAPYTFEQTWGTALRLLRVDLGLRVLERDEKAGYVLFEYQDHGVTSTGSLELLPTSKGVRAICQIQKFPSYHEAVLLDRLSRKLRDEHGLPLERNPAPDAGPPDTADAAAP